MPTPLFSMQAPVGNMYLFVFEKYSCFFSGKDTAGPGGKGKRVSGRFAPDGGANRPSPKWFLTRPYQKSHYQRAGFYGQADGVKLDDPFTDQGQRVLSEIYWNDGWGFEMSHSRRMQRSQVLPFFNCHGYQWLWKRQEDVRWRSRPPSPEGHICGTKNDLDK